MELGLSLRLCANLGYGCGLGSDYFSRTCAWRFQTVVLFKVMEFSKCNERSRSFETIFDFPMFACELWLHGNVTML